ncbi:MAG TPA: hypothetical protein VIW92_02315 [Thermoanaerobaculia bacterium]
MTDTKAQAIAQDDLMEREDLILMEREDLIEDPYCLGEDLDLSPEALRRDRLAHLFLTGLRLVMEDEQDQD